MYVICTYVHTVEHTSGIQLNECSGQSETADVEYSQTEKQLLLTDCERKGYVLERMYVFCFFFGIKLNCIPLNLNLTIKANNKKRTIQFGAVIRKICVYYISATSFFYIYVDTYVI